MALASAEPAAANCIGPTFSSIAEVDGGASLAITGHGWGEDCYDTGPPPPGVGILGEPIRDIEIVIAQGAKTFVVALGSADADYELAVTVSVPVELVPGEADLVGRRAGSASEAPSLLTTQPFVRSDVPPPTDATVPAIAVFGPDHTTPAPQDAPEPGPVDAAAPPITSSTQTPSETSRPSPIVVVGVVILVLAAVAGAIVIVRARARP